MEVQNRRRPLILFLLIVLGLASHSLLVHSLHAFQQTSTPVIGYSPLALRDLLPAMDYGAWFSQETAHALDNDYFGIYAFAPMSDTVYMGFGAARPGELDGALLAAYDGVTMTAVYTPTEQGFIDFEPVGNALHFPGPDPCCGDDWSWGNTYVHTPPTQTTKLRSLPNVMHAWGLWNDTESGVLYAAVSAHPGDFETSSGAVFSSTNAGESWTQVASAADGVGLYRAYDMIGLNQVLYVVWNDDYVQDCGLAVSEDDGRSWTRMLDEQITCQTRLFVWQDQLLALRADRAALFAVNSQEVTTYLLPDFRLADWANNYLVADSKSQLYTITDDGRVLMTNDLQNWSTLISTDLTFMTIGYWHEQDLLLLADRGENGRVWGIDLTQVQIITPPPAPEGIAMDVENDVVEITWTAVSDAQGYQIYRSTSPYFAPTRYTTLLADTAVATFTDDISNKTKTVTNDVQNYYYLIRTADTTGNLSLSQQHIGVFDFSITPGS